MDNREELKNNQENERERRRLNRNRRRDQSENENYDDDGGDSNVEQDEFKSDDDHQESEDYSDSYKLEEEKVPNTQQDIFEKEDSEESEIEVEATRNQSKHNKKCTNPLFASKFMVKSKSL